MVKTKIAVLGVLLTGVMLSCGSFDLMPPEGGTLWVAAEERTRSNELFVVEPTTGRFIKWFEGCGVGGYDGTEPGTGCMTWGGGHLWATGVTEGNEPYWCEIDRETGYGIEFYNTPSSGNWGGGIVWGDKKIWYTNTYSIYTINPEDNTYEKQFDTGWHGDKYTYHSNYGLAWDGSYLWSVGSQEYEYNDVYLYQFDVDKKEEIRRIRLNYIEYKDAPIDLTYDGEAFWLTTYRDGSRIYRISPIDGHFMGYIVPYWVDPVTGVENVIDKPFAVAYKAPSE